MCQNPKGSVERRRRDGGVELRSVSRWVLETFDSAYKNEGFEFHQLAVIVTEMCAARTINFRKQWYNVMRLERCERNVMVSMWRDIYEHMAFRGKMRLLLTWSHLCADLGNFTIKKARARSVMVDADKETKEKIEGDW